MHRLDIFSQSYTFNGAGIGNVLGVGSILNTVWKKVFGVELAVSGSME